MEKNGVISLPALFTEGNLQLKTYKQAFRMFPSMDWLNWSKSQETMFFFPFKSIISGIQEMW